MEIVNEMRLEFRSRPENESLARMVVSAFIMPVNPTLEQLGDVKTAVSEAVTNAIVHGYRGGAGLVRLRATLDERGRLWVEIADKGCGIADIEQAMQPLWSSAPAEERAGLGFTVMQSFTDSLTVRSREGSGTTVIMRKKMRQGTAHDRS